MAAGDAFLAHVLELLDGLGAVGARRMFGGYGLYRNDVMFALIADDTLYFKVDEHNRAEFEARYATVLLSPQGSRGGDDVVFSGAAGGVG